MTDLSTAHICDLNHDNIIDPLLFLNAIISGQDPRQLSEIYNLVCEIDELTNGDLDRSDWNQIVQLVRADYKYAPVSLAQSILASKTLAEYKYAKKKATDPVNDADSDNIDNNPLTDDEIIKFRDKFNEGF